ncbi:MAG: DUF1800 family protein [Pedosphaera sp.]|nr:DUF1800 family protein [Pedosphaera sp.]
MTSIFPIRFLCTGVVGLGFLGAPLGRAVDAGVVEIQHKTGQVRLSVNPVAAAAQYRVLRAEALGTEFIEDKGGVFNGLDWLGVPVGEEAFYKVDATQLAPGEVLIPTLLNRLAYGPTPDELERLRKIGPDAYIAEQLAPENIQENLEDFAVIPADSAGWQKVVVTGVATSTSFHIYLNEPGEAYVDEVRLISGAKEDPGLPNLVKNGEFNAGLTPLWTVGENLASSAVSADPKYAGVGALHLISTGSGTTTASNRINQTISSLVTGNTYTLSFYYLTSPELSAPVVRLSGTGTSVGGDVLTTAISSEQPASNLGQVVSQILSGEAGMASLRSWHLQHAVKSKRQLLEVMRQFLENHFVTEYAKSRDYLDPFYENDSAQPARQATRMELVENLKWRQALLNPKCTFYDLLKISAESPAMILFLDSVASKGTVKSTTVAKIAAINALSPSAAGANITQIANENYAREICELFSFGVDNGYDQQDIVQISRVWTGWTVGYVARDKTNDPFATNYVDRDVRKRFVGTILETNNTITNFIGEWSMVYKATNHHQGPKWCFFEQLPNGNVDTATAKRVPSRFGPPWAGREYGLLIQGGLKETNTLNEAYQLIQHLADQPFTEEYLSVKFCRLLVHEGFRHGYDFTDDQTSPEEELVHACMMAWEQPPGGGTKGQIQEVLKVIFASQLFRSHTGSMQKVRTPLEYAVATVRALRAAKPDGTYTAELDSIAVGSGILVKAGSMRLFDRAEPDGYPEDGAGWISSGSLAERLRFIQSALSAAKDTDAGVGTVTDPVGLLKLKAPGALSDAGAVADFFLGILFPAEGSANLAPNRKLAIDFLNSGDSLGAGGKLVSSPFQNLQPTSTAYDTRIRAVVSWLMTSQRFQEQ